MNRIQRLGTFCGLIAIPTWSLYQIVLMVCQDGIIGTLLDVTINLSELLLLLHVLVLATSLLMFQLLIVGRSRSALRSVLLVINRPMAWLGASLVLSPLTQHSPSAETHQTEGIPATGVISPTVAAGALAHILRRRREQIQQMTSPDRLTLNEFQTMEQIQLSAQNGEVSGAEMVDLMNNSEVVQILRAVERPLLEQTTQDMVVTEWALVVKLFGYPVVENEAGEIALFRKRRALELLTWLALNRDRSRRSAARTAMWDLDIADSTFSTIVSDMRRGLAEIDQRSPRSDWVPTTYSDELPLSIRVITDDVLMAQALESFRKDSENSAEIVRA
jgi:hypothetical protein